MEETEVLGVAEVAVSEPGVRLMAIQEALNWLILEEPEQAKSMGRLRTSWLGDDCQGEAPE